jgi:hypothetical protein
MHKVNVTATVAIAAVAAVTLTAAPATAAPTASTTVTFEIAGAGLDITAPATANLGSGTAGGTIVGSLGTVRVTDQRGAANASWTATVTATNFETGSYLVSPPRHQRSHCRT